MSQTETLSLLIADDEASIRDGLSRVIDWNAQHIRVIGTAKDGDEAFDRICRFHPDIVITDIKMPGCSGLDLVERVRRIPGCQTHFILLSGYDDFAFAQRAIRSKIACYLLKPAKTDDLIAEVMRIRQEIRTQRASGERSRQEQRAARQGGAVLKEQFYARLAEGEFHSENDILRVADSIRLKPISCPCAAVVFRFTLPADAENGEFSKADVRLFKTAFRNVMEELSRPIRKTELYADHGNELGILISPAEHLQDFLSVFVNTMRDISRIDLSVGIGCPAQTLLDIAASCRAAAEVSEYSMYQSGTRFFDYETLVVHQTAVPPLPPEMKSLAEAVVRNDIPGIQRELDRFFEGIFYIPMPPPRYVRGMCSYLLGDVSKHAAEFLPCGVPVSLFPNQLDGLETLPEIRSALLRELTRAARDIQKNKRACLPAAVEDAKSYIQEHVFSRMTVKDAAEHVHLSESYFTALFKKNVGITVQEYIRRCKLEKAKQLLVERSFSIFEISDRLEYKDYRSFYRAFKRFTGRTPTEFQQNMTRPHEEG